MNDKGYPVCSGAPVNEPHWLCFMERRDYDECPECGTLIPDHLKLNDDMTGPRLVTDLDLPVQVAADRLWRDITRT